jgi:hypothetical protein
VWAKIVVDAYWRRGAMRSSSETNFGAALVVDVVRQVDPNVSSKKSGRRRGSESGRNRWRSCTTRDGASRRVLRALESEMCTWVPDEDMDSPNRMDALVWGITFLLPEITRPPASTWSPAEERIPTGAEAMIPGSSRSFHGWHRCAWCWRSRSGLPPRPKTAKLRCASCGRFRKAHPVDVCDRCDQLGFEPLTLF